MTNGYEVGLTRCVLFLEERNRVGTVVRGRPFRVCRAPGMNARILSAGSPVSDTRVHDLGQSTPPARSLVVAAQGVQHTCRLETARNGVSEFSAEREECDDAALLQGRSLFSHS